MDIVIGNDRKHDLVRLLEEYSLDSVNDTVDDIMMESMILRSSL